LVKTAGKYYSWPLRVTTISLEKIVLPGIRAQHQQIILCGPQKPGPSARNRNRIGSSARYSYVIIGSDRYGFAPGCARDLIAGSMVMELPHPAWSYRTGEGLGMGPWTPDLPAPSMAEGHPIIMTAWVAPPGLVALRWSAIRSETNIPGLKILH
jgi:hypothetical protein